MAIVGVIPAAGYGTRLQPIPSSKEVYPVAGRPMMDYLLERMRSVASEIRVVTRPEKVDVVEHARQAGARVIEAHPPSLAASFLAGMEGVADDDVVLFGFPDTIWQPLDGYATILDELDAGWQVVLGLFRVQDLRRYEPVVFDRSGRVYRIEFKPERPSSSWLWGCSAAPAAALRGLEHEEEPGMYFSKLSERGVVGGVCVSETYVDMGTREGLREAAGMRTAE
jgi:dTDP-glucose pyrophosphorylase